MYIIKHIHKTTEICYELCDKSWTHPLPINPFRAYIPTPPGLRVNHYVPSRTFIQDLKTKLPMPVIFMIIMMDPPPFLPTTTTASQVLYYLKVSCVIFLQTCVLQNVPVVCVR